MNVYDKKEIEEKLTMLRKIMGSLSHEERIKAYRILNKIEQSLLGGDDG